MTTMSEPGTQRAGQTPGPTRTLRRSTTDRVISGVSGGLGQYFGVDPVIFRVLFAVLSFFGGVGVLAYGIAWLLIPGTGRATPRCWTRRLHELRVRKVPPWLVVIGGAVLVWIAWFSWWAPGTLPAVLLLAVVVLVLMHRLVKRPAPMPATPPWAGGVHPALGRTEHRGHAAGHHRRSGASTGRVGRDRPLWPTGSGKAPAPEEIPVSLVKEIRPEPTGRRPSNRPFGASYAIRCGRVRPVRLETPG